MRAHAGAAVYERPRSRAARCPDGLVLAPARGILARDEALQPGRHGRVAPHRELEDLADVVGREDAQVHDCARSQLPPPERLAQVDLARAVREGTLPDSPEAAL